MEQETLPPWLKWTLEIEGIEQTGVHFTQGEFGHLRYNRRLVVAGHILASYSNRVLTDYYKKSSAMVEREVWC